MIYNFFMSKSLNLWLILFSFSSIGAFGAQKEITILYTNDLHSHLVPHKKAG